jgi:hypothetical protein
VGESKVVAVHDWPLPTTLYEVCSFHGLVSFYLCFIKKFSTILAPITKCMKAGKFSYSEVTTNAFKLIKVKLTTTPLLVLPYFDIPFELHCDASKIGIGAVLSQMSKPMAYFSDKLKSAQLNYSTYDIKFYALVQSLKHWSSYLAYNDFILYSNHEALKHLNNQDKLVQSLKHWSSYLAYNDFILYSNHEALKHLNNQDKLVQSLKHWSSYLAYNDFILYFDHEALKHLNSQDKLSTQHAKWAAFV